MANQNLPEVEDLYPLETNGIQQTKQIYDNPILDRLPVSKPIPLTTCYEDYGYDTFKELMEEEQLSSVDEKIKALYYLMMEDKTILKVMKDTRKKSKINTTSGDPKTYDFNPRDKTIPIDKGCVVQSEFLHEESPENNTREITSAAGAKRLLMCNSRLFSLSFRKKETDEVIDVGYSCDLRFLCACPRCVQKRKNRFYKKFYPLLSQLYDRTYRKRYNLRTITLTANLDFHSSDEINKMWLWYREFITQEKRIISAIPSIHLDGNKIHIHMVAYSRFLPQEELSDLWFKISGFPVVDVRAIRDLSDNDLTEKHDDNLSSLVNRPNDQHLKGVSKALRYLTSYLIKPISVSDKTPKEMLFLFKETYNLRLIRPHGKHFRGQGKKQIESQYTYEGLSISFTTSLQTSLHLLKGNNSVSEIQKINDQNIVLKEELVKNG